MTDQEINEAVARKLGLPEPKWELYTSHPVSMVRWDVPDYCHDIKAAWEIVEKLRSDERLHIVVSPDGVYRYSMVLLFRDGSHADIDGHGQTAAMAICLAFLKLEER